MPGFQRSWNVSTGSAASSRTITAALRATEAPGSDAPRVVVLGGGFGGLYTAVKLETLYWPKNKKPQVTLVDQSTQFVFKPLLYDLLSGTASASEVAPTFAQLLAPYPVRYIQARAEAVRVMDRAAGTPGSVHLSDGSMLEYDYLVMALGSEADSRGVPGVMEYAVPFNNFEDAVKTKEALDEICAAGKPSGVVMVIGAGYAGVELVTAVAERLKGAAQVKLVTPGSSIMAGLPEGQRQAALDVLARLGVEVVADAVTHTRHAAVRQARRKAWLCSLSDLARAGRLTVGSGRSKCTWRPPVPPPFATPPVLERTPQVRDIRSDRPRGTHMKCLCADLREAAKLTPSGLPGTKVKRLLAAGSEIPEDGGGGGGGSSAEPSASTACDVELESDDGVSVLPAELVLWTAGASPATKAQREGFPFPITERGAVVTESTLRVQNQEKVFALGDVSTTGIEASGPASSPFPATAQVAFQQADYAAWNVWATINERPLLPFRYQHLGNMISLGQLDGAVALPIPLPLPLKTSLQGSALGGLLSTIGVKMSTADPDNGVTLQGPLAALARRAAYLYRQPTNEQRASVAVDWLQQAAAGVRAAAGRQRTAQQEQERM
ncbi:MAG: hypothetical protein WDW36_010168 [Sanguina aurantia]